MGRTNPTFRDLLRALETRWADYRRALRYDDQAHFDRLFEHAAAHADAAGYLNPGDPMEPVLVSMLLEQQKAIDRLRDRLAAVEAAAGVETTAGVEAPAGGASEGTADSAATEVTEVTGVSEGTEAPADPATPATDGPRPQQPDRPPGPAGDPP